MSERVTLSRRPLRFPAACCCCFAAASGTMAVKGRSTTQLVVVNVVQELALDVPVCAECLGHLAFPGYGLIGCLGVLIFVGTAAVGGIAAAILIGPVLKLERGLAENVLMNGLALGVPLAVTGWFLWRSLRGRPKSPDGPKHAPGTPVAVVTFDEDTVTLEVANPAFAAALRAP